MKIAIFTGNNSITTFPTPWCSFVKPMDSAKAYPWWCELIGMLKIKGYEVTHFASPTGDIELNCNKIIATLDEIRKQLPNYDLFISTDTFLPHMVIAENIKIKGIVLWSLSDPLIYGYPEFTNMVKRQYLRPDQFGVWHGIKRVPEAFPQPIEIINKIKETYEKT